MTNPTLSPNEGDNGGAPPIQFQVSSFKRPTQSKNRIVCGYPICSATDVLKRLGDANVRSVSLVGDLGEREQLDGAVRSLHLP